MSCPRCGGTSGQMMGPGLVRCTNVLYDRMPVPASINQPFAMHYQDVAFNCGYEYYDGSAQTDQDSCPEHGLFSSGMCSGCRSTAVCGRCGRWKCRVCRSQEEAAEAKAQLVQQVKEEAERQARKAQHDAAVRANTSGETESQQQYIAELRSVDRKIAALRQKLRKSVAKGHVSYVLSALVGLGLWLVSLLIIVETPVKPVSIFPFGIGLALMYPFISAARSVAAKSREANLAALRDSLLQALGCGKDCEYGCRKY
jgi:hypothetical protein